MAWFSKKDEPHPDDERFVRQLITAQVGTVPESLKAQMVQDLYPRWLEYQKQHPKEDRKRNEQEFLFTFLGFEKSLEYFIMVQGGTEGLEFFKKMDTPAGRQVALMKLRLWDVAQDLMKRFNKSSL